MQLTPFQVSQKIVTFEFNDEYIPIHTAKFFRAKTHRKWLDLVPSMFFQCRVKLDMRIAGFGSETNSMSKRASVSWRCRIQKNMTTFPSRSTTS